MPSDRILTIGAPPPARERPEWLKDRIVEVVAEGDWIPPSRVGQRIRWRHRPGVMPWHVARQFVGGGVSTDEFAEAVDGLIAEGRLIEVSLVRDDHDDAPLVLVRPRRVLEFARTVVGAWGRDDVLAREPWARGISAIGSISSGPRCVPSDRPA